MESRKQTLCEAWCELGNAVLNLRDEVVKAVKKDIAKLLTLLDKMTAWLNDRKKRKG